MATVNGMMDLVIRGLETKACDTGTSTMPHLIEIHDAIVTGSGASQTQVIYSDTNSVTSGSPVTYDLRGLLASILDGSTLNFAVVTGICIVNKSTTTLQNLQVGAGSNPWITWLGATGDVIVIGPSGRFLLTSPIDGYATTAGTADILTIAASTGTIAFDIIIWGR